jgi:hypothetical protein
VPSRTNISNTSICRIFISSPYSASRFNLQSHDPLFISAVEMALWPKQVVCCCIRKAGHG